MASSSTSAAGKRKRGDGSLPAGNNQMVEEEAVSDFQPSEDEEGEAGQRLGVGKGKKRVTKKQRLQTARGERFATTGHGQRTAVTKSSGGMATQGRMFPPMDVVINFVPQRVDRKDGQTPIKRQWGFSARQRLRTKVGTTIGAMVARKIKRSLAQPSFDMARDGASRKLRPRTDADGTYRVAKYDPSEFQEIDFGTPGVSASGTEKEQKTAVEAFRNVWDYSIRKRKAEAESDDPANLEASFCAQSRKLLQEMDVHEIWDVVNERTSYDRQAAVGNGVLAGDIMVAVAQLPPGTREELEEWFVYFDAVERRFKVRIKGQAVEKTEHGAYVGSGTAVDGGWDRAIFYEKCKRYAKRGILYSKVEGCRHLEYACLPDAEMHLRILSVFDKSEISKDLVVLIEGLWADVLQTIDDSYKVEPRFGIIMHCDAMAEAHRQACVPSRRVVPWVRLNASSPLRQGSPGEDGHLWQRDGAVALTGKRRNLRDIANEEQGGKCHFCPWTTAESSPKEAWQNAGQVSSEYEGKAMCGSCGHKWRGKSNGHSKLPTLEEFLAARVNNVRQDYTNSLAKQLRSIGCAYCLENCSDHIHASECKMQGYEGKACCGACNVDWKRCIGKNSALATDAQLQQDWLDRRRSTEEAPKSLRERLQDDGCVICTKKKAVVNGKNGARACPVPGYTQDVSCAGCVLSWESEVKKNKAFAKDSTLVQAWIDGRRT